jgi:hypothetical protein
MPHLILVDLTRYDVNAYLICSSFVFYIDHQCRIDIYVTIYVTEGNRARNNSCY